jgi:glycosyltransferase involved in cell wall biosynthesis
MPAGRAGGHPVDVLIVSLGSTQGLRAADEQLLAALERAGARVALARVQAPRPVRTLMLTDLRWARSARKAAVAALAQLHGAPPRAIVYSSTTAALMWPQPGAIRFDAPAAGNRPGRHGLWQRPLETRRLASAPLLLPWSVGAMEEAPPPAHHGRVLVVPVAVESSGPPPPRRDIAAITYAANPVKKGLGRVLEAWQRLSATGAAPGELLVAGAGTDELEKAGLTAGGAGVRIVGRLAREDYRALLRRARVFVCAPRREDYGIAQLEALADGCLLVTTPAPGPYAALGIARELDRRLVGEDLEASLRIALEQPPPGYAERARAALAPFSTEVVDRLVAEQLLARLLGEGTQL